MTKYSNFNDAAHAMAAARANDMAGNLDDATKETYDGSFVEGSEMARLSIVSAPEKLDMPDSDQVAAAVDLMMRTMFDVLRDTRMEEFATDLVWGFTNSFHMVAKRIEGREDDATRKLGEMARCYDPSEIYQTELEDQQLLCQTLEGCRDAMECMRDHAAEVYRVETGRPFSTTRGSRVSSKLTASMIESRDYIAAKSRARREQYTPTGPVVAFSGGAVWHDDQLLWERLDQIKRRIPEMVLATTAQMKGCDAIAAAWAAKNDVKVVMFRLDRSLGMRGAFVRNDRMLGLSPVEAIVCEGSGVQSHLAKKLREAGVPIHIFRTSQQRDDRGARI